MPRRFHIPAGVCALLIFMLASLARAGHDDPSASIYPYNRDTGEHMPVKSLTCRAVIEGPVARMHYKYVIDNHFTERVEVCFNLHLPEDTLLTGFGYYYKDRFIKGVMYDKQKAWEIYQAVTSRGRDPGVMDRDSERDYHTQVYPVEPKHDLVIEVDLLQVVGSEPAGLFHDLPLVMSEKEKPIQVDMRVEWRDVTAPSFKTNYGSLDRVTQQSAASVLQLSGKIKPAANWVITKKRPSSGTVYSLYSGMTGHRQGFYLLMVSPGQTLVNPHARIINHAGTNLSMPTVFGEVPEKGQLFITGRYKKPGKLRVELNDSNGRRITVNTVLSSARLKSNYAAPLWADKRIAQLQSNYSKDWRKEIIKLSQRYNVMSEFTSLLAIPKEELDYYKKVLAKENVNTNTDSVGGGGGDPWISVKAPENARRVVAIFPQGEAKDLAYDARSGRWSGRFDIPFGTAPGTYRVTIIVVRKDGSRTRFILEYQNLLSSAVVADATSLRAARGQAVTLRVRGSGIERAVALSPWGDRATLTKDGNAWQTRVTVPRHWRTGESHLTVILLDGAHNRTEISVDMQVY